ncbi:MAG: Rpn family recombination-promoting nuclease/putative transposase [Acidobacteria bacterium]|nr:Rpn family recombination-promoting nuclease/putative transposase [Acidobacteriota bacterium]
MRFINPKTDFAFKKIFGSDQSKPILMSFLNALLYDEQPIIVDLEIIDPYLAPKIEGMKDTFVDVRARLQSGRFVIIEMQVLNVEGFEKRVLYNAAKAYSTQLMEGDVYKDLSPVVALTITDFVMFPESAEIESAFVLKERKASLEYPQSDIQLVFVELPKFTKALDQLTGIKDKWLFFLKNARDLQVVPDAMGEVAEIKQAFHFANLAGLSPKELEVYERKLMFIRDQRGAIALAEREAEERGRKQGEEKGEEKGRAKGRVEGLEEGEAIGRTKKAREIASQLLGQLDDQQIAQITGLSLSEIAALRGATN